MSEEVVFTKQDLEEVAQELNNTDKEKLYIGLYFEANDQTLEETMNRGINFQFDYVIGRIFNKDTLKHNISTSEYLLKSESWSNSLIGLLQNFELKKQIEWAIYLSLPAIIIDINFDLDIIGNILIKYLEKMQFWFHVKIHDWNEWIRLTSICDNHNSLSLVLELPLDVPDDVYEFTRWFSEPIKSLIIPTDVFIKNKDGEICLSKSHLKLIHYALDFHIHIIIKGNVENPNDYKDYLLNEYYSITYTQEEMVIRNYFDFLQIPLQPLMENIQSVTYEVFEKDRIKYDQYEKAIYQAILDQKDKESIIIYILGAGRGGLIKKALRASKKAKKKCKIIGVEKNPNAYAIIEHLKNILWQDTVEIVHSDMRDYKGEKGDIIVSELLGSFGDNELSPECLDGASHLVKEDTIMIPKNYTSYLSILYSTKFNKNVKLSTMKNPFEVPYVCNPHQCNLLTDIKDCFYFEHPNHKMKSNDRYKKINFTVQKDGIVHGIIGYFESHLYGDVYLSIHPATKDKYNPEMQSWFPIIFPISSPFLVKKDEKISINLWRESDKYKVWYEWDIYSERFQTITHNMNGKSYWIGKN